MKVKSLKFTKLKGAVYIVLAAFLVSITLPVCAATPEKITDGYTTASGGRYDLIKGVFKFPTTKAIDGKYIDIPARFFYSDGFFS